MYSKNIFVNKFTERKNISKHIPPRLYQENCVQIQERAESIEGWDQMVAVQLSPPAKQLTKYIERQKYLEYSEMNILTYAKQLTKYIKRQKCPEYSEISFLTTVKAADQIYQETQKYSEFSEIYLVTPAKKLSKYIERQKLS